MTKETKIGLLVGMGFIILIGILVSDHLSEAQKDNSAELRGLTAQTYQNDDIPPGIASNDGKPDNPPILGRKDTIKLPDELNNNTRRNNNPIVSDNAGNSAPINNSTTLNNLIRNSNKPENTDTQKPFVIRQGVNNNSPNGATYQPEVRGNAPATEHDSTTSNPLYNKNNYANQNNTPNNSQNIIVKPKPDINSNTNRVQPERHTLKNHPDFVEVKPAVRAHHVQQNETLSDISKKYYGTVRHWRLIYEHNKSVLPNPNVVREGVRIVIPDLPQKKASPEQPKIGETRVAEKNTTPKPVVEANKPKTEYIEYTVKEGDMLSKLAAKFYGKQTAWPKLHQLNKSVIPDPDRLKPGTVIRAPRKVS